MQLNYDYIQDPQRDLQVNYQTYSPYKPYLNIIMNYLYPNKKNIDNSPNPTPPPTKLSNE